MPTEAKVQIVPSELALIVESVFENMLGMAVTQCQSPWTPAGERLTSIIHLAGDWNGALLVECNRQQACGFAGRFLSAPAHETVDDVVRDMLGELANMIGGNLKSILTRGIQLSMPSVVDGDYSLRVCGAVVLDRLAFECSEGVFWIAVLTTKAAV